MKNDPGYIDHDVLVAYLSDELSAEEKKQVESWLDASAANRQEFELLNTIWNETGKLSPAPVAVDVDSAWSKVHSKLQKEISLPTQTLKQTRFHMKPWYFVAAAILVLGILSIVFSEQLRRTVDPLPLSIETFAEVLLDTLGDGSEVTLNQNSQLSFRDEPTDTVRKVELKGEAFFSVSRDTLKPFIVDAGIGQIRVLGTEFNVKAYDNEDVEVFVESGLVEVSTLDDLGRLSKTLRLYPGDKGVISRKDLELNKTILEQPDELFWANRKLIFRETNLGTVFEVLAEYYEFTLEVEHEKILECSLTASFTNDELDHIFEVIAVSFELDWEITNNIYHLKGEGCTYE